MSEVGCREDTFSHSILAFGHSKRDLSLLESFETFFDVAIFGHFLKVARAVGRSPRSVVVLGRVF